MPTRAEQLQPTSTPEEIRGAISACVSQVLGEKPGMEQEQAVAMCYAMARKATGKSLLRQAVEEEGTQGAR